LGFIFFEGDVVSGIDLSFFG